MCGIVGIIGQKYNSEKNIKAMNQSQYHRGPDDYGYYSDPKNNLSLGMTRLSIIDIEHGKQPLKIENENLIIIFNGEIYNSNEIRTDLETKGEKFFSKNSDTEVILRLYKNYGFNFLDKLNGMFSFAIFDKRKRKLFIVRDRFGIKPLYYYNSNNNLIFSSEIKAILKVIDKPCIDDQSFYHFSSLRYIPLEKTIYKNIYKLLPGHYLVLDIDTNVFEIKKWWTLKFNINYELNKDEWIEIIKEKIYQSVKNWTISDVNYAFSMSGGLDSNSLIAANSKFSKNFNCYSVGFKGDIYEKWNEMELSKEMKDKYNINLIEIYSSDDDLISNFHEIISSIEEPYGGGLPSYTLYKEISKNEKVVISGLGGDELFGNYNRAFNIFNNLNSNNSNEYKLFDKKYHDKIYNFSNDEKLKYVSNSKNLISTTDLLYEIYSKDKHLDIFNKVAAVDMSTQLPDEFLNMTDKFSMIHSIEARTPFLDHNLAELVFSMPYKLKFNELNYKSILREAMGNQLTKRIRENQNKKGFRFPVSLWMRSQMKPLIEKYLGEKNLSNSGYLNPKFYKDYVDPFLKGDNKFIEVVWGFFVFHYWEKEIY